MPVNISEDKQRARDFLKQQSVGVLSSIGEDGSPDSAAVYFVVNDDLTIDFVTKTSTQKHKNIKRDKRVALVVFDPKYQTTVQLKGSAEEISDKVAQQHIFASIVQVSLEVSDNEMPPVTEIVTGEYSTFKITPTALRLAVFSRAEEGGHSQIFETII